MNTYVIGIHSCGGSMGEAVWPQWTRTVKSEKTGEELEKRFNSLLRGSWHEEVIAVVIEVEDPEDEDAVFEELSKDEEFFEDEDPEEAALHAKVDDLMAEETRDLNRMVTKNYQERRTYIQPEFTRYPVTDEYQKSLTHHGAELEYNPDEEDPLRDWTDEQLAALSDDEFARLLQRKRLERAAEDAKEL